jgi:uncharacterized protein YjcR
MAHKPDTDEETEYPADAYKNESVLRELYGSGLSMNQMADRLSCSPNTISYWMKKHGVLVGRHSDQYSRKNSQESNRHTK